MIFLRKPRVYRVCRPTRRRGSMRAKLTALHPPPQSLPKRGQQRPTCMANAVKPLSLHMTGANRCADTLRGRRYLPSRGAAARRHIRPTLPQRGLWCVTSDTTHAVAVVVVVVVLSVCVCVCVCVCKRVHTYTHIYNMSYTHTHTHTHTQVSNASLWWLPCDACAAAAGA